MNNLAELLERKGAGKLALRLRRGFEGVRDGDGNVRLGFLPRYGRAVYSMEGDGEGEEGRGMVDGGVGSGEIDGGQGRREKRENGRLPNNHWDMGAAPPPRLSEINLPTLQQRKTQYYNHLLSQTLKQSGAIPSNGFNSDLNLDLESIRHGNRFQSPGPGLHQLQDLLHLISTLETKKGFIPNKVTGNIVLRCWLRCGAGIERRMRYRVYRGRPGRGEGERERSWEGEEGEGRGGMRVGRKWVSGNEFGVEEVRAIWEVLARVMEREISGLELDRRPISFESTHDASISTTAALASKSNPIRTPPTTKHDSVSATSHRMGYASIDSYASDSDTDNGILSSRSRARSKPERDIQPKPNIDPYPQSELKPADDDDDDANILNFNLHIKPFCSMIKRQMTDYGDYAGKKEVIHWEKEMKVRLLKVAGKVGGEERKRIEEGWVGLESFLGQMGPPDRTAGG